MKKFRHLIYPTLALALFFASCRKDDKAPVPQDLVTKNSAPVTTNAIIQTFDEGFESASKTSYADANVTLSSGSWDMNDALIGSSTSDAKVGSQSVRIRNTGILGMNFDVTTGASTVTVKYATYGSDGSSAFQLWVSSIAAALIHK